MTGPPVIDLPIPSGRLLANSPQSQSTGKRKRNEQNDSSDETEGPQKRSKMSPGEAHVGERVVKMLDERSGTRGRGNLFDP
ncbi:hypothetical protein PNOK_0784200 [Pyrrhoderma noxium]|uniref:Uncharacterized protein n=1 Tax=Pyrrhoderma noxium TaxID=2282107 RepID=A0A286U9F4_9AGAM|nr:hypothetical protein PNOK_0784200 [Pyrrhoderma noxium]